VGVEEVTKSVFIREVKQLDEHFKNVSFGSQDFNRILAMG